MTDIVINLLKNKFISKAYHSFIYQLSIAFIFTQKYIRHKRNPFWSENYHGICSKVILTIYWTSCALDKIKDYLVIALTVQPIIQISLDHQMRFN